MSSMLLQLIWSEQLQRADFIAVADRATMVAIASKRKATEAYAAALFNLPW